MMLDRRYLTDSARLLLAVALAASGIAGIVATGFGAGAREQLRYGFAGAPATFGDAASIFANNAKLLAAILAMAAIVQIGWRALDGRSRTAWRIFCDLVLAPATLINVATIGVGIGAYGGRMLRALLPHGPLELAAFALAGSVYLRSRRGPLTPRAAAPAAALAVATLAAAALLETFAPR